MNAYMMEITMPYYKDEEFVTLIPRQRQMIGRLLQTGVISSFSLNFDRTKSWMTIFAENEEAAFRIVESFPMYKYMTFEIDQLIVTDRAPATAPTLVLN